jgi:hypothetical protein
MKLIRIPRAGLRLGLRSKTGGEIRGEEKGGGVTLVEEYCTSI